MYPPDAGRHPSVGYVRNLSAEGLLSMSPTLILGEHDMGPDTVLQQITGANVDVIRVAEVFSAQGIAHKVICVGRAIGREAKAREFVDTRLRPMMDRLHVLGSRGSPARVAVLLNVSAGAPMAAGANTSGDGLLDMAGAENVFTTFSGWKPVSVEYMSVAAPELMVIPERGVAAAGGIEALLASPLIRMTPAGRSGNIVVMDGMAMLGFGPRTLSSALQLAERLNQL
jgi:iron complex transport system substrate-binding protein